MKTTQKDRVLQFLKSKIEVAIWELEQWAMQLPPENKMLATTAVRHLHTLMNENKDNQSWTIKHPNKSNGFPDKHRFVFVDRDQTNFIQAGLFEGGSSGSGA